jgi:hypothetical protein
VKLLEDPVLMVLAGGAITSVILLLVVVAVIQFRFKRLPAALRPNRLYDIALIVSVTAILALAVLAVKGSVEKFRESSAPKVANLSE